MIGRLSGTLIEKQPPQLVIDVAGVGYEVDVPMSTIYVLGNVGEPVTLFTHMLVREDAQLLYAFATRDERDLFRALIKITGIGAKIALAILSGLSADELAAAIATENITRLSKVPGIGKKTAERLVLELKGKLGSMSASVGNSGKLATSLPAQGGHADVLHALLALGYNEREAASAMKELPLDVEVAQGIKLALRQLVRA